MFSSLSGLVVAYQRAVQEILVSNPTMVSLCVCSKTTAIYSLGHAAQCTLLFIKLGLTQPPTLCRILK